MKTIEYHEIPKFQKDFKKLTKRFKSLSVDFALAKKATIELYHLHNLDNQSVFQISGLSTEKIEIYKMRKFACKALKGKGNRSGMRVIYAWHKSQYKVDFLEIYYKSDQENEDSKRIKNYLKRKKEQ